MARAKRPPAEKSMPLWMNTFCDLALLLMTFFVLLFSMSVMDTEKWKEVVKAFAMGDSIWDDKSDNNERLNPNDKTGDLSQNFDFSVLGEAIDPASNWGKVISDMENMMADLQQDAGKDSNETNTGAGNAITMHANDLEIILRCPGDIAFDTMSAEIKPEFRRVIRSIMRRFVLPEFKAETIGSLRIEGHTDERRVISGHPSIKDNWDLSSARARAVQKYIIANFDVDPAKTSHEGKGEWYPLNPGGKSKLKQYPKNRRVEFILKRNLEKLPQNPAEAEEIPEAEHAPPMEHIPELTYEAEPA